LDAGTPEDCCAARDYRSVMESMNSGYFPIFSGSRSTKSTLTKTKNQGFPGMS
jgi:hypothetical protein